MIGLKSLNIGMYWIIFIALIATANLMNFLWLGWDCLQKKPNKIMNLTTLSGHFF